ncbi:U-box domain-containing protein 32 isoform X2 [Ricinus communis]|uniref:U-box domain-containing protein 32 isoform X2 n=1 Tax=Ricinus communis TaxID=3988 RepID=UPI00201A50B4|nr:U-box domain-containing protein 32 isoform X2 [Ricinus communis]
MGSIVDEIVEERAYDVENTIFVAVGKNVAKGTTALLWTVQSFAGLKICLLHVHRPPDSVSLTDRRLFLERERKKMLDVLSRYCLILDQKGVHVDKVWIEMENIEKGIVEIIAQYNIRWLVMGAAADKYYSKKLAGLKSKKARFVRQHAPISCHIWFACKGCLIYTREGRNDRSEAEFSLPLLLLNSDLGMEQPALLKLGSFTQIHKPLDAEGEDDDLEEILESFNFQCSVHSKLSSNTVLSTSKLMPLLINEVKALENLCIKEISLRKEMEEELIRKKQEVEKTKNQRDEFVKELQKVQEHKFVLEGQLTESNCMVNDLEEKIISAVELLISFKAQRDAARREYENARREANRQRKLAKVEAVSFCRSDILEFSFVEINEATQDFDPSWKIGEGKYGSVYKGILRHAYVAIKMLPSYGSQSQLDFRNGVEVLGRVRHPHLVTLIGTCPESRSLVYEYVRNGSLEDCLACKNKRLPLPWQTRIRIATEICSALIFLHSNKPCIIHGNLKLSKVLLDSNSVSKLSDFGISLLIPKGEKMGDTVPMSEKSNPNFTSVYTDPEYLERGTLIPGSDVYSFGIILLQLLTARPVSGLVKDVKCALEKENLKALLDFSSGDWPIEQTKLLAKLALDCCENNRLNRPDLVSEIWSVLEPMRASCGDSLSCLGSKELQRIPSHFVCPIFQEVMKDPQIAADGFTYDADAIRGWLKSGHNTSPMTNLKLEHCNLLPNHALHQAIQEWQQRW